MAPNPTKQGAGSNQRPTVRKNGPLARLSQLCSANPPRVERNHYRTIKQSGDAVLAAFDTFVKSIKDQTEDFLADHPSSARVKPVPPDPSQFAAIEDSREALRAGLDSFSLTSKQYVLGRATEGVSNINLLKPWPLGSCILTVAYTTDEKCYPLIRQMDISPASAHFQSQRAHHGSRPAGPDGK